MSWIDDKEFSDVYLPQITTILKENAKHIINIMVAPYEADALRATDFIIKVEGGDVAGRLRRSKFFNQYRDWTIRSRRISGVETELSKLKKGFARWYLYGWIKNEVIDSWMLIDLNIARQKRILDMPWHEKDNHDGTWFIVIPANDLIKYGCVVSSQNIAIKGNIITKSIIKVQYSLFDFLCL